MARKGEVLALRIPQRKGRDGTIILPVFEQIPRSGWNGLLGRRISNSEVDKLAELGLKHNLDGIGVRTYLRRLKRNDVGSPNEKRKRRRIYRYTLSGKSLPNRIQDSENKPIDRLVRETYSKARKAELHNRRLREQLPNSAIQIGWSRLLMRPKKKLAMVARGLMQDNPSQEALFKIQDAVRAGIESNFPELQDPRLREARKALTFWGGIRKLTTNKYLGLILDVVSAGGFVTWLVTGGLFGLTRRAVDRMEGKMDDVTASDTALIGWDLLPIPTLNAGSMANAKERTGNILQRGYYKLALDAMTNVDSPMYRGRAVVAEAILATNTHYREMRSMRPVTEELPDQIAIIQPRRRPAYNIFDLPLSPVEGLNVFSKFQGGKRLQMLREEERSRWQATIVDVINVARAVRAEFNPQPTPAV